MHTNLLVTYLNLLNLSLLWLLITNSFYEFFWVHQLNCLIIANGWIYIQNLWIESCLVWYYVELVSNYYMFWSWKIWIRNYLSYLKLIIDFYVLHWYLDLITGKDWGGKLNRVVSLRYLLSQTKCPCRMS